MMKKQIAFIKLLSIAGVGLASMTTSALAQAPTPVSKPSLVISSQPVPYAITQNVYRYPTAAPDITREQVAGAEYYTPSETMVSRKIEEVRNDLKNLQAEVTILSQKLVGLQGDGKAKASDYYASVATISTQLQTGTTPGNPRLVQRMAQAQDNLEALAVNITDLNELAIEVANVASMGAFLLEAARATYGISGAVEEDHVKLAQLEDQVNNTLVVIERLQNNVNDDITRTAAYLTSERANLRTMSLAIANGDLYGKSLSSRPFSNVQLVSHRLGGNNLTGSNHAAAPAPKQLSGPRPLVKIKFDKSDVSYEQPVYLAVSQALETYPDAQFELVAVYPSEGNAAQVAIESTRSRRSAEKVLRTLTQMGLTLDRIDLSHTPSDTAQTSEVHLFIR